LKKKKEGRPKKKSSIDVQTISNAILPTQPDIKTSAIIKIQNANRNKLTDAVKGYKARKELEKLKTEKQKAIAVETVSNNLVANIFERSLNKLPLTVEEQTKKVIAAEKVSSNLVANLIGRSLSKIPETPQPLVVEKQNKKQLPVEVKFDMYMEKLKNSDLPNDEKVRKGTIAYLKLEEHLNKKKTVKQVEQPKQDDEIFRQQQHQQLYDLLDDNYKHIGILIQKITNEYQNVIVGTIPKEIIDIRKNLDFRLNKYTSNVIQILEMLRVNFGENIEAHLYNIEKIKKAIYDRQVSGWGQK
jgi:hypothetical protein